MIFEDGSLFYLEDVLEDPKKIQPLESVPIKIKAIHCVETATLDDGSLLVLMICNSVKVSFPSSFMLILIRFEASGLMRPRNIIGTHAYNIYCNHV